MADKHSLNYDVRELKLGASFTNNKTSQYHTIKYDFKPASVDVNKMATVEVGTNNQVTVTVPHLDGAGVPQTVFKGSQRPYTKECVLIIDRVTGEITLEKLSSNIQVKKTRQESAQKPRPLTPVTSDFTNTTQRSTSRTRVATNRRTNNTGSNIPPPNGQARFNGAPAPAGILSQKAPQPQSMVRSPARVRTSPPQAAPWSGGGNSTLASLPMIGLDDALAPPPAALPNLPNLYHNVPAPAPAPVAAPPAARDRAYQPPAERHHINTHPPVAAPPPPPAEDSSSSSSSDSGSDSGSDSDSDNEPAPAAHHALTNGTSSNPLPSDVLNDDLCLSESGSDSE